MRRRWNEMTAFGAALVSGAAQVVAAGDTACAPCTEARATLPPDGVGEQTRETDAGERDEPSRQLDAEAGVVGNTSRQLPTIRLESDPKSEPSPERCVGCGNGRKRTGGRATCSLSDV